MDKNKAIDTLISAVEFAQTKGAFTLVDAGNIIVAITVLKSQDKEVIDVKKESKV